MRKRQKFIHLSNVANTIYESGVQVNSEPKSFQLVAENCVSYGTMLPTGHFSRT